MYSYSANDPLSDGDISFANNPHGSKPVYLMHRSQFADDELPSDVKVWDLRNYQVTKTDVFPFVFHPSHHNQNNKTGMDALWGKDGQKDWPEWILA